MINLLCQVVLLLQRHRTGQQYDSEYTAIVFNVSEYRRQLNAENIVTVLRLVRQLVDNVRKIDQSRLTTDSTELTRGEHTAVSTEEEDKEGLIERLSENGARFFASVLKGLHQQFFKACLRKRNLDAALEYARFLPPDPYLFTMLLKACTDYGNLFSVTKAVEVGNPSLYEIMMYSNILW